MSKHAQQLTFDLPAMDSTETRRQVEEYLETVFIYRQVGFIRREAATTANCEPRYHGNTYTVSKSAENVAMWNVSKEEELERKAQLLDKALYKLTKTERELIERRYLREREVYDYNVCEEMHLGERKYRRVKARAMYILAYALRLEVLIDPVEEKVSAS